MRVSYEGDGSKQRNAVRKFAEFLEMSAASLRMAAQGTSMNLDLISWENLSILFEQNYADVLDALNLLEEDDELDVMEGEDIDTSLHPLDPDNEDDETWYEGFDDV